MSRVSMRPKAVEARLHRLASLSDLDPARRLDAKIGYSVEAVVGRLRTQSMLSAACRRLERLGRSARRLRPRGAGVGRPTRRS